MRHISRAILTVASAAAFAATLSSATAFAQRRQPPATGGRPPATAHRQHPVNRGSVVFVGGYFYDPFFGPYPWWSRWSYPYYYYPVYYDDRAVVRIEGVPDKLADNASVYVDGFYSGIVEDFDGFFEGLPLSPGGHDIVFYMDGYRTVRQHMYLSPASSYHVRYAPERLPEGVVSEPPTIATPVPAPPEGTYLPPATQRPAPSSAPRPTATTGVAAQGTLVLRVQPGDAEVRIDGEPWASSDGGRFMIQVPAGTHRLEVGKSGYLTYSTEFRVTDESSSVLNVALTPERP